MSHLESLCGTTIPSIIGGVTLRVAVTADIEAPIGEVDESP